eukprot:EG_transcript_7597
MAAGVRNVRRKPSRAVRHGTHHGTAAVSAGDDVWQRPKKYRRRCRVFQDPKLAEGAPGHGRWAAPGGDREGATDVDPEDERLLFEDVSDAAGLGGLEDSGDERQRHAYIGLEMTDSLWLRATRVRHGYGALKVIRVKEHSPAARSGIQVFDFIVQVNSRRTPSLRLFKAAFQKLQPGRPCRLVLQRRHKYVTCKLVPTVAQHQPGLRRCRTVVAAVVLKPDGGPGGVPGGADSGTAREGHSPGSWAHDVSPARPLSRRSTTMDLDHSIVHVRTPRVMLGPAARRDGETDREEHDAGPPVPPIHIEPLLSARSGASDSSGRALHRPFSQPPLSSRSTSSKDSATRQRRGEQLSLLLSGMELALSVREPPRPPLTPGRAYGAPRPSPLPSPAAGHKRGVPHEGDAHPFLSP